MYGSNPIDIRHIGPLTFEAERDPSLRTTRNLVWLRADGDLPDDPLLHVCLVTYASDMTLLDSVLLAHGLSWADGRTTGASLDHAMWFHGPFRADRWLLYAQDSPVAQGALRARARRDVHQRRRTRGLGGARRAGPHLLSVPGRPPRHRGKSRGKTSCPVLERLRRLCPCPWVFRRRLEEGGAQDAEHALGSRGCRCSADVVRCGCLLASGRRPDRPAAHGPRPVSGARVLSGPVTSSGSAGRRLAWASRSGSPARTSRTSRTTTWPVSPRLAAALRVRIQRGNQNRPRNRPAKSPSRPRTRNRVRGLRHARPPFCQTRERP